MCFHRSKLPLRLYSTGDESYLSWLLASVNAYLPPVFAGWFKFNKTVNEGKEGVVPAHTYIVAGINAGTPLADQNGPGVHTLSGVSLHSQPLGLAIPTVAAGAASFFMRHLVSPLFFSGESF